MKNTTKRERKMFIEGMECAIEWIRQDMSGGALRQFDLHTWKILDYIKQAKILNKLKKNITKPTTKSE